MERLTDAQLIETPLEDPYVNPFIRPNVVLSAGIIGLPNR